MDRNGDSVHRELDCKTNEQERSKTTRTTGRDESRCWHTFLHAFSRTQETEIVNIIDQLAPSVISADIAAQDQARFNRVFDARSQEPSRKFSRFAKSVAQSWRCVFVTAFVAFGCPAHSIEAGDRSPLRVESDPNGNKDIISGLAFSPDGQLIAVAYGRFTGLLQDPVPGQVILWDVENGKQMMAFEEFLDGVSCVVFSPKGEQIVVGSFDGSAKVIDIRPPHKVVATFVSGAAVTSVSTSSDGSTLAIGVAFGKPDENGVKLWDAGNDSRVRSLPGHANGALTVAHSPDAKTVASAGWDQDVRIWDVEAMSERQVIHALNGITYRAIFSPDGALLATAGGKQEREGLWTLCLWECSRWEKVATFSGEGTPLHDAAFSPDGKLLAAASDSGIARLWDVRQRREVKVIPGRIYRVAFSPEGELLAAASESEVVLLDVRRLVESK